MGKTTITNFVLNTDVKNKDSLDLIVSDIKGFFYIYNINKNSLINQFRIHDTGILNFKISTNKTNSFNSINEKINYTKKTLIYSIDTSGILKIF